ncbi:hypothetical protein C8A03DRAFT_39261 [Achaetomium macrosporum]|uniref:Uncharacterized protein n=1 Tax=Achaetomium macrosporum TaxID=79813 RepID=A0AAN7H685_9PEZI|nr:hypothetical protein C8A03DRAFT_39261 [Achaetomium macrosporum]
MQAGLEGYAEVGAVHEPTNLTDYYWDRQYDANPASAEYSQFLAKQYPDARAAKILLGVKFNGLSLDQIVYFGLFMQVASKRELKFN